jgi:uncharacterized protein (DUF58 family)
MIDFLPFIIFLMILAVFIRAESALTIFYLIIGIFLLGYWWTKRSLRYVSITRDHTSHAFLGEDVSIQLTIKNRSILPILWLEVLEGHPLNLPSGKKVKQVISLNSHEEKFINYHFNAYKRGYYSLGPTLISSGDPLGLINSTQVEYPESPITVYPQIVNLNRIGLPSQSPFGTIKHKNPIFEDPNRIIGKRDFINGDSLRKIDWKSTAATGQLQVKLYEASISLEIVIILDLHSSNYSIKSMFNDTELAITAAASTAAWGKLRQQMVGLVTNGSDPLFDEIPCPLKPKKGSEHLIHILEILARIKTLGEKPIRPLIQETLKDLSWGTTLVLITGGLIDEETLGLLYHAKKKGINPALILVGSSAHFRLIKHMAKYYKIQLYPVHYPMELSTIQAI